MKKILGLSIIVILLLVVMMGNVEGAKPKTAYPINISLCYVEIDAEKGLLDGWLATHPKWILTNGHIIIRSIFNKDKYIDCYPPLGFGTIFGFRGVSCKPTDGGFYLRGYALMSFQYIKC